jgi:hypothetical protein
VSQIAVTLFAIKLRPCTTGDCDADKPDGIAVFIGAGTGHAGNRHGDFCGEGGQAPCAIARTTYRAIATIDEPGVGFHLPEISTRTKRGGLSRPPAKLLNDKAT